MGLADDLKRFHAKVETRQQAVFAGVVDLAHESIQVGSPITGAPGQPVDTGALRDSWQKDFAGPDEATISTNLPYARSIEDGVSYAHGGTPLTQRSPVGGFHSVARTIASWKPLVASVVERVRST